MDLALTRKARPAARRPLPRTALPVLAGVATLMGLGVPGSAPAATSPAAAPPAPEFSVTLPGDAVAARVDADASTWLVGARPGSRSLRLARRFGGEPVGGPALGIHLVARGRARALAAALRRADLLVFAEPNRRAALRQGVPVAPDPLSDQARWRDAVVDPNRPTPPVTPQSPLLALVDSHLDATHPEFAGSAVTSLEPAPAEGSHGTATAAVAAAPANGVGILGVWPGMRALNVGLPETGITCADSAEGVRRAIAAGAAVINMSYGAAVPCVAEYVVLQFAVARGIVLVAAAGNEFAEGNPLEYPASLPHVLTVAAVTPELGSAFFSNASSAMDLGAPGVGILTAVRPGELGDDDGDGYAFVAGTSFAAPMVAAAATWVRAARPELSADQVAQVVRLSARDLLTAGWDPATGFGLLNVDAALARPAPPADPLEPNDEVVWVDGRAFGRPARAIWSRGRSRSLFARLDRFEDPADLYRVVVPSRGRVRITTTARYGDVDLAVYSSAARSTTDTRRQLGRSARGGRRSDVVTVPNGTRRSRTVYVAASMAQRSRALDAGYTLRVGRR